MIYYNDARHKNGDCNARIGWCYSWTVLFLLKKKKMFSCLTLIYASSVSQWFHLSIAKIYEQFEIENSLGIHWGALWAKKIGRKFFLQQLSAISLCRLAGQLLQYCMGRTGKKENQNFLCSLVMFLLPASIVCIPLWNLSQYRIWEKKLGSRNHLPITAMLRIRNNKIRYKYCANDFKAYKTII